MQDTNFIEINLIDAGNLGMNDGDKVKLVTPSGEAQGTVKIRRGVRQGTIAVEYGYGHWGAGAKSYAVDGKTVAADPKGERAFCLIFWPCGTSVLRMNTLLSISWGDPLIETQLRHAW